MSGGSTISKTDIIDYPPEKLYDFECVVYEYIDNLHFILDPSVILPNSEPYIKIVKERFDKEQWHGDGNIGLIWIPPFMLKESNSETFYGDYGQYHEFKTTGVVLWHVKQESDGISYLLYPQELASQFEWYNIHAKKPILVDGLGKIYGRDAVYLEKTVFISETQVRLSGVFNGSLCSESNTKADIPYTVTFNDIIDFRSTELDFYEDHEHYSASFEYYLYSAQLKKMRTKNSTKCTDQHKHYVFHTHDRIFEIIATEFEIVLNEHV